MTPGGIAGLAARRPGGAAQAQEARLEGRRPPPGARAAPRRSRTSPPPLARQLRAGQPPALDALGLERSRRGVDRLGRVEAGRSSRTCWPRASRRGEWCWRSRPGAARWSAALHQRARRLILVDVSERPLALCRAHFAGAENVDYVLSSGDDLPGIADASVDAVGPLTSSSTSRRSIKPAISPRSRGC